MPESSFPFTDSRIRALSPAATGKRAYYTDLKTRGLQLCVTDSGAKSFYFYRRIEGRPTRKFLGRLDDLGLDGARGEVERLHFVVSTGGNPIKEAAEKRARTVTLREAFAHFKRARTATLKPRTLNDYERFMEQAFGDWYDRQCSSISRALVLERHRTLGENKGERYANNAMRALRAVLGWATKHYRAPDGAKLLPENPVRALSDERTWFREKRRDRVIPLNALPKWFDQVLAMQAQPADSPPARGAAYLLTLLLTGMRAGEASGLRWRDVDMQERTIRLHDTKNRTDFVIPVPAFLFTVLGRRRQEVGGEFAFKTEGRPEALLDLRVQIKHVIDASGVYFSPHDLRRTFASATQYLGFSDFTLKRLMNHKQRDVTAGYIVWGAELVRERLQEVERFLLKAGGIVTLREAFEQFKSARAPALKRAALADYERFMERHFAGWLDQPCAFLTRDAVRARHREIGEHDGPQVANGAMRALLTVLGWVSTHYRKPDGSKVLADNPVRILSDERAWFPEKRRDRSRSSATVVALRPKGGAS